MPVGKLVFFSPEYAGKSRPPVYRAGGTVDETKAPPSRISWKKEVAAHSSTVTPGLILRDGDAKFVQIL